MNINRITPWLYQGMQPNVDGYQMLKGAGITAILTCNRENPFVEDARRIFGAQNVCHLQWNDDFQDKPLADFTRIDTWAALLPTNRVVYTHCAAGINRATVGNVFLLMREGMSGYEAFNLIVRSRPVANGWNVSAYRRSLLSAQEHILGRDVYGKPIRANLGADEDRGKDGSGGEREN